MSKPISKADKRAFEEFLRERVELIEEDDDSDAASFSISELDFLENQFEFHAANYNPKNTCDFFELLASSDEFECEQDGYEDFYVSRKTAA